MGAYIVLLVYLAIAVGLSVFALRMMRGEDIDYPWSDW